MDDFVWEDPPTKRASGSDWDFGADTDVGPILSQLKTRPNVWAMVFIGGGYASNNRTRKLRAAGCEVQGVRIAGGRLRKLYARWCQ